MLYITVGTFLIDKYSLFAPLMVKEMETRLVGYFSERIVGVLKMTRNRFDAAIDAHTSNLSRVQEELAVQRLLSAFDPKRADIVQYLQRFSEKTEELGWSEEKKKNTLKYVRH